MLVRHICLTRRCDFVIQKSSFQVPQRIRTHNSRTENDLLIARGVCLILGVRAGAFKTERRLFS